MKIIYTTLILLSLLVTISTAFAKHPKCYNCKQVGISKVKPFKHRTKTNHINTTVIKHLSNPRFLASF